MFTEAIDRLFSDIICHTARQSELPYRFFILMTLTT